MKNAILSPKWFQYLTDVTYGCSWLSLSLGLVGPKLLSLSIGYPINRNTHEPGFYIVWMIGVVLWVWLLTPVKDNLAGALVTSKIMMTGLFAIFSSLFIWFAFSDSHSVAMYFTGGVSSLLSIILMRRIIIKRLKSHLNHFT